MRIAVIIPAAGFSSRYESAGGIRPKLEEDLGGKPVLLRTLELFSKFEHPDITIAAIIVAGPHEEEAFVEFKSRHMDRIAILGGILCRGGKTHRYETVQSALAHVPADCTHIAVHDAARPCTPPDMLDRVFEAAQRHDAVIPAIAVADTLKRIATTDEAAAGEDPLAAILSVSKDADAKLRIVESTIDRTNIYAVQTPQVFKADLLKRAYSQASLASTDDAALVERLGERIVAVDGDERNLKITRPIDLRIARGILGVIGPHDKPAHKRF